MAATPSTDITEVKEDPSAVKEFVVAVGAVTLNTGQVDHQTRKPIVARLGRGDIITAPANHPDILDFLRSKSIVPHVPGQKVRATTARDVIRAYGAQGDPVAQPAKDVLPVPAGVPNSGDAQIV